MKSRVLSSLLAVFTLSLSIFGCASHSHQNVAEESYEKSLGNNLQKDGLMSQKDWMDLDRLDKKSKVARKLEADDFQQLIGLLQARTNGISGSASAASVHVTAMSIFQNMTRSSPSQRTKIIDVTTPLLSSSDKYERIMAKQVLDKFKAGA